MARKPKAQAAAPTLMQEMRQLALFSGGQAGTIQMVRSNNPIFDTPIPPRNVRQPNDRWVMYGWDDLLPQMLRKMSQLSPTHGSILRTKWDLTGGKNVVPTMPQYDSELKTWNNDEGIEGLMQALAADYQIYDAGAVEVFQNPYTGKITHLAYCSVPSLRRGWGLEIVEAPNKRQRGFWRSVDWETYHYRRISEPHFIPAFNPLG